MIARFVLASLLSLVLGNEAYAQGNGGAFAGAPGRSVLSVGESSQTTRSGDVELLYGLSAIGQPETPFSIGSNNGGTIYTLVSIQIKSLSVDQA